MELFAVAREGRAVPAACLPRDGVGGRVLLLVVQSGYVKLEAEKRADATESFDKLTSFLRSIGNKFQLSTVLAIIIREPLCEGHGVHDSKLFCRIRTFLSRGFSWLFGENNLFL